MIDLPSWVMYCLFADMSYESRFLWADSEVDLCVSLFTLLFLSRLPDKCAYFRQSLVLENDLVFLPQV